MLFVIIVVSAIDILLLCQISSSKNYDDADDDNN